MPVITLWFTWMTVAAPGTIGSSPDFAAGPIIPNSLFPIHIDGTASRNGKLYNPDLANPGGLDVPALDSAIGYSVDGHSHFPMFVWDNYAYGPAGIPSGSYVWEFTMKDRSESGWRIVIHLTVKR